MAPACWSSVPCGGHCAFYFCWLERLSWHWFVRLHNFPTLAPPQPPLPFLTNPRGYNVVNKTQ